MPRFYPEGSRNVSVKKKTSPTPPTSGQIVLIHNPRRETMSGRGCLPLQRGRPLCSTKAHGKKGEPSRSHKQDCSCTALATCAVGLARSTLPIFPRDMIAAVVYSKGRINGWQMD